ncbi:hypothetical protein ABZP36_009496 [Zizania latifolia]
MHGHLQIIIRRTVLTKPLKKFLRFMFPQTLKVLKSSHQASLCLKQIFIHGDYGVILVRFVIISVTFTVGISQKANIDAAVKKFSDKFTTMLFHYDGWTTEWDEFEWSKRANIHVSVRKQTKWLVHRSPSIRLHCVMILEFRENVAASTCFHDRKDAFMGFLWSVLKLKEEDRDFNMAEKTNYLLFMINAFQFPSLSD